MSANDPKRTFPWPQLSVYTHIINGLKLLQRGHRKIVKGAAAGAFQSDLRLVLSHAPGFARDSRARLYLMAQEESRSGRRSTPGGCPTFIFEFWRARDQYGAETLRQRKYYRPTRLIDRPKPPWGDCSMRRGFCIGLFALACIALKAEATQAAGQPAAPMDGPRQACPACHGAKGEGIDNPYFPRLAGKPAGYLYNQLLAFKNDRRDYPPRTYPPENRPA